MLGLGKYLPIKQQYIKKTFHKIFEIRRLPEKII